MSQPIDTYYSAAKQAIQTVIVRAPISQSRLAHACGVTRQAMGRWLNEEALPTLPRFLRLRDVARQWGDLSLCRLGLPPSLRLVPRRVPEGWQSNADPTDEVLGINACAGHLAGGVLTAEGGDQARRALLQRSIDDLRRLLFALEEELRVMPVPGGDALPDPCHVTM